MVVVCVCRGRPVRACQVINNDLYTHSCPYMGQYIQAVDVFRLKYHYVVCANPGISTNCPHRDIFSITHMHVTNAITYDFITCYI
jgi:hypothetical protein